MSLRILVVDDTEILRELYEAALPRVYNRELGQAGEVTVICAASGEAGLAAYREGESFDLVISDLKMPGMDGVAFIQAIRAINPRQMFALASGHHVDLAYAGVELGIQHILQKPFQPAALVPIVSAVIEQRKLTSAPKV